MDAFIGEVRVFPWNWAPQGWFPCDGRTLQIQVYPALASLIGTKWGGNGQTTFQLPNFQGFVLLGAGQGPGLTPRVIGSAGATGAPQVQLIASNLPPHTHSLNFAGASRSSPGTLTAVPTATAMPSQEVTQISAFSSQSADSLLNSNVLGPAGVAAALQPHSNVQPVLAMQFYICVNGTYPEFP